MNKKQNWLIFLLLNNTLIVDNTLSYIIFREPINKSDETRLKQQENFSKEEMKGTQSTNEWEIKEVVLC